MRFLHTLTLLLALVFFGFGCTKEDDDPPPPPCPGLTGTPDTTFGTNGAATYDGGMGDEAFGMALQSDGKALVTGASHNGTNNDLVLLRFNTDGSLDTTFDTDGVAVYDGSFGDTGYGVALQADGKAVVAGASHNGMDDDLVVLRFNTDGTLDPTFGTGGVVTYNGSGMDAGRAVAIQADGKALVTGVSVIGATSDIVVLRFNTDGSLDTTFDTDGMAIYDSLVNDYASAIALQADGKILVAGWESSAPADFILLLRFNTDGSLDTSFDTDGIARYNGSTNDRGTALAVQADGKALVVGDDMTFILLVRFETDGLLDNSWFYDSGPGDLAEDVVLQSDGRILIAGQSNNGTDNDVALLRFNTDGSLDGTFGTNSVATFDGGSGNDCGYAVALQADGKALVAGSSHNGTDNDIVLLRFQ
jgi:uncharacterized delta-60 repeat protein